MSQGPKSVSRYQVYGECPGSARSASPGESTIAAHDATAALRLDVDGETAVPDSSDSR